MAGKFILRQKDVDMECLRASASMTVSERLRWPEETRDFLIRATPESTLRLLLEMRTDSEEHHD
jgi:hypothetical protein